MTMRTDDPVAFGDLRGWIDALRKAGELHEVDAEVDIDFEIGTIMRLAQGPGTGPAMLFNNLKGYNKPTSRCRRIFGSALNNNRRIAHDARAAAGDACARTGQARPHHPAEQYPAAHRQDRTLQGERRHRQGRRP